MDYLMVLFPPPGQTMAIQGIGNLLFATSDTLYVGRPNSFTLALETEDTVIQGFGFDSGKLQTVDSFIATETWTITLSTGSFDKTDMSFVFDRKLQTIASISLPETASATISTTTNYDVTGITGLTTADAVQATLVSSSGNNYLTAVTTTGTLSATQFRVKASGLEFGSSNAGATVVYRYLKAFTSVESIGGTATQAKYGKLAFSGRIVGDRFPTRPRIYCPQMSRTGGISLEIAAETTAELTFNLETPTGWSDPFVVGFGQ